jgi:hypothetical protein
MNTHFLSRRNFLRTTGAIFALPLLARIPLASAAATAPVRLAPNSTFTVPFPEMPPTFYAAFAKKPGPATMTVYLPTNYDRSRTHPLLIFLSGGPGGAGGNPGVARALTEDKDFICVNMPLFKKKIPATGSTKPDANGASILFGGEDGPYMWPYFKTMLTKLDAVVPNIDRAHRILGGFSNGAHATQGLIDSSAGEIVRGFSAFFFVEGGGHLEHYDLLQDKPFLMVSSNNKSQPRAQEIADAAKAAGAKATLVVVDVGKHDFPVTSYPQVREWLRGPAMAP